MNFALLGADRAAQPLLAAIAADPAQDVLNISRAGDFAAEVITKFPAARVSDLWDEVITDQRVDAVIVAGDDAEVLEGAKQLANAGKPLIVFPRATQGTTWFYELGLVRDDTHVPLVPIFNTRFAPQIQQLRDSMTQGTIGKILQLQLNRQIHVVKESTGAVLLTGVDVERTFFPDVDLLRWLGGDYSRVTSFQSGLIGHQFSQAINTLSGDGMPESVWTIAGTHQEPQCRLIVTGESGTLSLTDSGKDNDWVLAHNDVVIAADGDSAKESLGRKQLQHCVQAIEGQHVSPDWADLTRTSEICDGVRRSIRKRRTIDLHFESTSERSQFKTHMTAVGCSLLSLTMLGVIFVLIAGTLLDPRDAAEIKADHAGAIFYVEDFAPSSAELAAPDEQRMKELAVRMRGASFPVLIEIDPGAGVYDFGEQRRITVAEYLTRAGADDAAQRTQLAELKGRGFQTLMLVARLLVFVPLGLFLLLQLLLFVTRPASSAQKSKQNDQAAETLLP